MATNKFFKSLLFALTITINLFGFGIQDSSAYPVFAQQNYSNFSRVTKYFFTKANVKCLAVCDINFNRSGRNLNTLN